MEKIRRRTGLGDSGAGGLDWRVSDVCSHMTLTLTAQFPSGDKQGCDISVRFGCNIVFTMNA